ncbi:MAG: bifunctional ADP-dependent NAD(P)H-hydrate dehydratase/NAD(P)H-hydrate epimerase [Desulfurococcales archaeon ex4484_58]|nr:MAG: bifunctional ADP-dependent NAD(P)H-hydrate dehydratase/NAD(P)H-hydrate epimerase [Desulfurococcales archaeon ex4484_58]
MTITTLEMRVLETNTVALGVPLKMLMEAAGKSIADYIASQYRSDDVGKIVVMVGKGGNGGDGLVAARYLSSRGFNVEVLPAYSFKEIEHPDTRYNLEVVRRIDSIKIHRPGNKDPLKDADIIIDGLLGTGVKGELREPIRGLVEEANNVKTKLKVAIDTPSGLNPDTGEIHGIAFKADVTITFHDIKPGLQYKPDYTGKVIVANIGIPREAQIYVGPGDVIHRLPPRPRNAHKGVCGRIAIIGGSHKFTGAPALTGLTALAAGSDLAFLIVPDDVRGIIASYSPELITLPYQGTYLGVEDVKIVIEYIEQSRPHVVVIGPGLSDRPETLEAIKKLLPILLEKNLYLVVDADALKTIVLDEMVFNNKAVLTPHRGEFQRISNQKLTGDLRNDGLIVSRVAFKLKATILLKAPIDIISNGIDVRYNRTGNPYMSIGGTGDVLSGLVASFLARTKDPYVSAYVAAYINGLAGDYLLSKNMKVSPTKIIEVIPTILNKTLDIHLETYISKTI